MNYEEKYKEALKIMESLYNVVKYQSNSDALLASQTIEKAFPELRESEDERIRKEIIQSINDNMAVIHKDKCIAWLEKQGGQKSVDKVEPKFHEGDWVVYKNDICQIVKREEGCNKLVTVFGIEKELVNERNLSTARLWTIQDAKDGDVLYLNDNNIVIFKDLYDSATFHSYCHIEDDVFNIMPEWWEGKGFQPATKEQRELLFQKMKEAGYEWDAEKKELKKIENEKK